MALNQNLKFTNLDFQDIKDSLKDYLKGQTKFRDYDYSGSNMAVLIDLLSYNTFLNNFHTNMAVSEMFLDSVRFRDNIISHSKELNYLVRSRRSSRTEIRFEVFPTESSPTVITIPARETWQTIATSGTNYNFSLREAINVTPTNGRYLVNSALVYEGAWVDEFFEVTGDEDERFVLSNNRIDTTSIRIWVRENENSTTETEYTYKNSLYGVDDDDTVYYLQPHIGDRYEIEFGQDNFGKEPIIGNVIRVEYQVCAADAPNGSNGLTFTGDITIGDSEEYSTTTTIVTRAEGGAERESIESIRFNAPNSIQIQNRAITNADYKNLITANFPEVTTVSVYGGEKIFPPQYGRVFVAVDTAEFQGISDGTKEKITTFLENRSAIAIEPIVINAKFMYLDTVSTVTYNLNKTSKSSADIQNLAKSTILNYSENNLEQFGTNFRYSKLIKDIDDTDTSIVSNDTTVRGKIEIKPNRNQRSYFVLQYSNALSPDKTFPLFDSDTDLSSAEEIAALADYVPCVVTSTFTYGGQEVYIQDNGKGRLDIMKSEDSQITFVLKDVGSVDYDTGDVIVRYITIEDYDNKIDVYARIKAKDIEAPTDRILFIRNQDITVNTKSVRI